MAILVVCVGNEYQKDDGFGVAVAEYLQQRYVFDNQVQVVNCAVMGYSAVPLLVDCTAAVVVDAVDGTGLEPGTLVSFEPQDMQTSSWISSLHEVRFADVLQTAQFMGSCCGSGHCFGVQVLNKGGLQLEKGLSTPVAQAVAPCARAVVRYLQRVFHVAPQDLWAQTEDSRADLDDPEAYVQEALRALGAPDTVRNQVLKTIAEQHLTADYALDALLESLVDTSGFLDTTNRPATL